MPCVREARPWFAALYFLLSFVPGKVPAFSRISILGPFYFFLWKSLSSPFARDLPFGLGPKEVVEALRAGLVI